MPGDGVARAGASQAVLVVVSVAAGAGCGGLAVAGVAEAGRTKRVITTTR